MRLPIMDSEANLIEVFEGEGEPGITHALQSKYLRTEELQHIMCTTDYRTPHSTACTIYATVCIEILNESLNAKLLPWRGPSLRGVREGRL